MNNHITNHQITPPSASSAHCGRRIALFFSRNFCSIINSIILATLTLATTALTSNSVSALSCQSTTDLQFTFNPVVSINISGGDLSIANLTPGSYADSNEITVTAGSNSLAGYTLYATVGSSSNSSTELRKDGIDTANKFSSITSNIATLSSFSDNSSTWGYSYSTDSGSTWVSGNQGNTSTGYNGLPLYNSTNAATGVILADTPSASSSTIQFKIGARATTTQASGSYSNVVNFIGVPKVITRNYTIAYDANSGTGAPSSTSGTVTSTDPIVTLSTTVPTREGYTFEGWCDVSTSDDTCSGTTTQPGHIYAVNTTNTSAITVTMYAMWKEAAPGQCTDRNTCMQTMTIANCPTTNTSVTDARDGKSYTVAKLADGKCWMTQNLNLAGGTALSVDDTDVDSSYISSFSTSNNLTKNGNTIVLPASSTSGFNISNYSYVYNSGNKTNCGASGQDTPCYSYYSWDAATLGSGRSISTENTDAPYSICPKGWRLPTSGNSSDNEWKRGDFYALATAYGANLSSNYYENSATFYNNAGPGTTPNFLLAGLYYYGSFYYGGSYGSYWSSTSGSDADSARNLYFNSGYVNSADDRDRNNGFSVRCLLRD